MNASAALRFVVSAVADDRVVFSDHALFDEMPVERVTIEDVLQALASATEALAQNDAGTKWKLYGTVVNGDDLAVVVSFHRDKVVIVVTVHPLP